MKEYRQIINDLCKDIHNGLIDFDKPRGEASRPTQANSEFITNKQQGDWAEDVIFRAINDNSSNIVAVRYGKSDDLVAGDIGFEDFYQKYQDELDTIGKRPDLLLFKKEDFDKGLGTDISQKDSSEIGEYVKKAIAGIEIRSSAFLIDKYMQEANRTIDENIRRAIIIRDKIIAEYKDILEDKRPELINTLIQIERTESSVKSVEFRVPTWRSSQRLQDVSSLLSELKKCVKTIQKRNNLSITPKIEDLKVVHKWIMTYNVPHFYVQVFFDRVYGVSFKQILELISNPQLEDKKFFVEQDTKNQNKTTIKIPSQDGICLVTKALIEPNHHSVRKELNKGRLLFYVRFDGGEACLDKKNFDQLFNCDL